VAAVAPGPFIRTRDHVIAYLADFEHVCGLVRRNARDVANSVTLRRRSRHSAWGYVLSSRRQVLRTAVFLPES
jgi:hypothetical protein